MNHTRRITLTGALALSLLLGSGTSQAAPEHPAELHKTNPPPSAELNFHVSARQSGFPLGGSAVVKWQLNSSHFSLHTETRSPLFGRIHEGQSDGQVDDFGLAPSVFREKRIRRDPIETTFDRSAKAIRFSTSAESYPLLGGEQDRNTAMWQLLSIARATPAQFKAGSNWALFVAGQRDAEVWTFRVVGQENLHTGMGDMSTVHVIKEPAADNKGQRVDIWLIPALEWYPARVRITEPDGDYIEQTLENVSHPGA